MSTQPPSSSSSGETSGVRSAPKNGIGLTAMILGIIGFMLSLIPLIGVVAWPLVILGLIFGLIGIVRAYRKIATNMGMAIAGTALSALGLVVCIVYAASFSSHMANAPSPPASVPGVTQGGDEAGVDVGFGQPYMFSGGETITISPPEEFSSGNPYMDAPSGKELVQTTVTVHNGTDRAFNPASIALTAQHGGRVASQSYLNSDALPDAEVPPGGDISFSTVWEIGSQPGELRISAKPNVFAQTTAYWVGQV
ncbi:hypothetical protein E1161_04215 [Saccharopolyspora aridisoli]|uniref:DUF4190 domain-containing protein n=1 Tax=Saccharopolyspora aridisoli TaxID=2530385 RepID=A0A4R4V7N5_9PSEU|nr:DUF4190 domain-containing protein [Saccharopolyspora aridisoli]TDC95399.1 hypothetical protein E1161_04215 [Saccharopolyspora aridisoli]